MSLGQLISNYQALVIGAVGVIIILCVVIVLLLRGNLVQGREFLAAVRENTPLLDAIEHAGNNVPPGVVRDALNEVPKAAINAAATVLGILLPFVTGGDAARIKDAQALVAQLEDLRRVLTDNLPNTPPATTDGREG